MDTSSDDSDDDDDFLLGAALHLDNHEHHAS
jgi:hypothetical protein